MSQTKRVSGVATKILHLRSEIDGVSRDGIGVQYHQTVVAAKYGNIVRLNSGGWRTATTKLRMNQFANQYGLAYGVYQKDYNWYVSTKDGDVEFYDGMEVQL